MDNTVAKKIDVQDIAYGGTSYTYNLVNGAGSEDNYRYVIIGDYLIVNSLIEYDSASIHNIRIKITNDAGNHIEQNFKILINETINTKEPLKANNLITPNGDNINDVFEIYNPDIYSNFQLIIYDDNGVKTNVYNSGYNSSTQYNNTWNGVGDNGAKLNTGLYYYYLSTSNKEFVFKGSFYLIQP